MKTDTQTSKAPNFRPLLTSMSKEELNGVATALGVKVAKSNKATIANLETAIDEGKAQVKAVCTISFKPADGERVTYFGKTLRSYVSGPGHGDETWLVPATPVGGSPAPDDAIGE